MVKHSLLFGNWKFVHCSFIFPGPSFVLMKLLHANDSSFGCECKVRSWVPSQDTESMNYASKTSAFLLMLKMLSWQVWYESITAKHPAALLPPKPWELHWLSMKSTGAVHLHNITSLPHILLGFQNCKLLKLHQLFCKTVLAYSHWFPVRRRETENQKNEAGSYTIET